MSECTTRIFISYLPHSSQVISSLAHTHHHPSNRRKGKAAKPPPPRTKAAENCLQKQDQSNHLFPKLLRTSRPPNVPRQFYNFAVHGPREKSEKVSQFLRGSNRNARLSRNRVYHCVKDIESSCAGNILTMEPKSEWENRGRKKYGEAVEGKKVWRSRGEKSVESGSCSSYRMFG